VDDQELDKVFSGPWRRELKESTIIAILLGSAIGLTLAISVGFFLGRSM
jgi:hypothetical protein